MKYKKLPVVLGAALILAACSNDATSSDITVVEEQEAVQSYEELDERMTEFILASETKNYGKVYEMTNVEGKSILDEKAEFYDSLGGGFPDDDELSKYVLQSRLTDNAYEILRFNLFEENDIMLYLFKAHYTASDLTFAFLYYAELHDGKWEIAHKLGSGHNSDFYYPYLGKSEMTGRSLSKMVKEYPSNAEVITTKEQSSLEFEELQKSLSKEELNIANQFLSKGQ